MRIFDEFPQDRKCLVCRTGKNRMCILAPVAGTQHGNITQAVPVHLDCAMRLAENVMYDPEGTLYGRIELCATGAELGVRR